MDDRYICEGSSAVVGSLFFSCQHTATPRLRLQVESFLYIEIIQLVARLSSPKGRVPVSSLRASQVLNMRSHYQNLSTPLFIAALVSLYIHTLHSITIG